MDAVTKTSAMQKTRDDCIANLKKLYPDIKDSDMKTIVHSIFNLLKVTDKVEAQHTKKRAPRKMTEARKKRNDEFNAKKKQEAVDKKETRLQKEEDARQGKPAEESPQKDTEEAPKARQTPQGRAQEVSPRRAWSDRGY